MKRPAFCFLFALILIGFLGCASHKAVRQPSLTNDLYAQENKVENEGISCMVKPICQKSELEAYFDDDLLKYGIMPVQIAICNKEHGCTVGFAVDSINLIDPSNARVPVLRCEQVIDKTERSYWRTAGWAVAFGVFGLIPSAINVNNTNKKIRADYESRSIKGGNLVEGGTTEGLVFFAVPEDMSNLSGWKVAIVFHDRMSETVIPLEYGLAGTMIPPKDRKPKKPKNDQESESKG